ncbi:MAG: DUF4175 family protein [Acetobacteraceae bacterium]
MRPRQAHGAPAQDLTANPWAGLPVIATLVARDAPGQRGASAEANFVLPERPFKNPPRPRRDRHPQAPVARAGAA